MANLNRSTLIGRVGQDIELRYTSGGTAVASFSLATSEKFRSKKTGEMEEKTEWHSLVLWDKLAEVAAKYLGKGKSIYVEGRIQTTPWVDKDGHNRTTTEIVCDRMQMLDAKAAGKA